MVANLTMAVNCRSRDDEPDRFNLETSKQAQVVADYEEGPYSASSAISWTADRPCKRRRAQQPKVRVDRLELLGSSVTTRKQQEALAAASDDIPF